VNKTITSPSLNNDIYNRASYALQLSVHLLDEISEVSHLLLALLNTDALDSSSLLCDITMHNPSVSTIIQSLIQADQDNLEDEATSDGNTKHGRNHSIAVPVPVV
jgi:hypothetical protein